MHTTLNIHKYLSLGIPLVLLGVLAFLMRASFTAGSPALHLAITVDLLLTVPLVYFLLIRKTDIPKSTVIPVMVAGLLLGLYLLPKNAQTYLLVFKTWALPVIEVFVLALVITKVSKAVSRYKKLNGTSPDFFSALKEACAGLLSKRLVLPFATEIAVLYYGFVRWSPRATRENEFTYHKNSGTPALLGAFVLIIGIETFALHFLLIRWSLFAAWLLSALSIYTALQVIGFARSLSKRPIAISAHSLSIRYGILNEAEILLSNIEGVDLSKKPLKKDRLTRMLSPLGALESHNVLLYVKNEEVLTGLYGIKKRFKVLALHLDKPLVFEEKIQAALLRNA